MSNCKIHQQELTSSTETSAKSFTLPNLTLTKPLLDTGCSDTAFRQSDIGANKTRRPKLKLTLKTASGQLIQPVAHVIDSHGPVTSTTHIFEDKDLHMSLKSVADFTSNDCTVTFDATGYEVKHVPSDTVINSGTKDPASRVWTFSAPTNCPNPTAAIAVRNDLDLEYVKYYHAVLGSPPESTFEKCCAKGYFGNLPRLTSKMIRQNPPNSVATSDGHLNRTRQHIRSTSTSQIPSDDILTQLPLKDLRMLGRQAHLSVRSKREQLERLLKLRRNYQLSEKIPDSPEDAETSWDDTIYSRLIDLNSDNEIHSDATGRFPFESARGTNYVLVFVYKGYIHVQPLNDRSAVSYVKAHRLAIEFFKTKGHAINIARLDNETSEQLETFLSDANIPFQYVPPEDHRSNRAERAIQSFKNHFISILATIDDTFPMAQWDELLLQTELTLSFLRPFAGNTKISSYQGIHGVPYDWLAHPMAPAGTKVKIYDSAEARESWQPHSSDGWYLGPALKHYRSYHVIRKESMRPSVSNSLDWFPARIRIPGSSKEEILVKAIEKLQVKIETLSPLSNEQLQQSRDAIDQMKQLFVKDAIVTPTQPDENESTPLAEEQRVPETIEEQRVTDHIEEQRVTVIDESNKNESAPTTQHPTRSRKKQRNKLRKQKAKESPAYRSLTAQESKFHSQRLDYIGREWTDTESNQVFKIDDVVMSSNLSGPGSRTAYFKFFDVTQKNRPTAEREYEHTACQEIQTAKYVQWFVPGYAHSILSAEPRDESEPPMNLDCNNKPLKYKSALTSKNKAYWDSADIEEYRRLFLSHTCKGILRQDVPQQERGNITYYNRQVKEKPKTVNNKLHTEFRVRGTYGGDLPRYFGPVSTTSAEYATTKALWLSTLANVKHTDPNTRFVTMDLVDFYLGTPLDKPAYMRFQSSTFPQEIIDEFDLHSFVSNGEIIVSVHKCMYGHPAAGFLSHKLIVSKFQQGGFSENPLVSGLFSNGKTTFVLIVDDLGIRVNSDSELDNIEKIITDAGWKVKIDKSGSKFLGMRLNWNYDVEDPTLEIDAPDTMPKALARFADSSILRGKNTPSRYQQPTYGPPTTDVLPTPTPRPECKERVQQVAGTFLHYARTIDYTMLEAVNTIGRTQAAPTSDTLLEVDQLLHYAARFPNNKLVFKASEMILRCMYDASHMIPHGKAGAIFYASNATDPPEVVHNVFDVLCKVIPYVTASASESEYAAAFLAGQQGYFYRNVFEALGHPQPPVTFFGDNKITVGISNDEVKIKRGKAIEKSYHWFRDMVRRGEFTSKWIGTDDNIADYFTKALPKARHNLLKKSLVQVNNSSV